MATAAQVGAGGAQAPSASGRSSNTLLNILTRLGILFLVDAFGIWLVYSMWSDGNYIFGGVIATVTILVNLILLRAELYPLRWMVIGLALLFVMVLYPVVQTVFTAFTNYGDGHLLTKQVVIEQLEAQRYLPEGASTVNWTAYVSPDGTQYLLFLEDPNTGEAFIARPGEPVEATTGAPPETIGDYRQLSRAERLRAATALSRLQFGADEDVYQVSTQQIGRAAKYQSRYQFDAERNVMVDMQTGKEYLPVRGTFTAEDGSTLRPGWRVNIGFDNFSRLFTSPSLRGPFTLVFLWTVVFAIVSVFVTFALGLFLAVAFDVPEMPMQKLLRSLLLIPYAIPAFVSVPIWVGLLNPQYGIVSDMIRTVFGTVPAWFSDPFWSKAGIILIQMWLGFPYMFVIATGALQALPADVYEAAAIDGARPLQAFFNITLPLLMITMGPLLVASFAFNFNNFVVIDLYNQGGPPMTGTASPVGHTDILATYTFRLAFASGRGADLGYAAAITVIIFLVLLVITFFQFRFTNMLEERSENV